MKTKTRINGCLFLLTLFFCCGVSVGTEHPNVLFIAVDDLNDWIGCLKGHPQALTPNMDRLAKRGVLFTNAHCAATACNPSRAAVFSGRLPKVTGVWSNDRQQSIGKSPLKLLPAAFAESGYQCSGAGKLFHGGSHKHFPEYFAVNQRWSPFPKNRIRYTNEELPSKKTDQPRHILQDSLGRQVVLPLNGMPSDRKPHQADGESFDWGGFDVPDSDFGDTQITDWAIQKLQRKSPKPFFLAVGYYRPHIPLWAPQRFFERFKKTPGQLPIVSRKDLDDLSPAGKKWAIEPVTAGSHVTVVKHKQWQAAVEAYLACVTYVDHEIGRLLDALDRSDCANDTLIVLWSDHGWHLGEKEHWGKWTGWERSTKVPLMIIPPQDSNKIRRSARCHRPVGLIDLYPTLVELCQLKSPTKLDGQSLVPVLHDPDLNTERAVVTFFDRGNFSIGTDHLRYIRYADGSEELYDHRSDPHEWTNLARLRSSEPQLHTFRKLCRDRE